MAGQVFKLPDRKRNVLERMRRQSRHQALDQDKSVQRRWKRYKELTKGASRWDKKTWYDLNYPNYLKGQLSRYVK